MTTVLVTGHTGLIGRAVVKALRARGDIVRGLTRSPREDFESGWDYRAGHIEPKAFVGVDAVIHLAGEDVAGGRWTATRKRRIRESRELGTRLLAETMAALPSPPGTLISMSGMNYYASDGLSKDEESPPGASFLSSVCEVWERAADPAREAGIRVVHPRLGIVLAKEGGALAKMLPAFRLGLGGRIGSGTQAFRWVSLRDVVGILLFLLDDPQRAGPVNVSAPGGVRQRRFARTLAGVLRRPARFPLPVSLVSLFFGEMGRETLLSNVEMVPKRLTEWGYPWHDPELEPALRAILD